MPTWCGSVVAIPDGQGTCLDGIRWPMLQPMLVTFENVGLNSTSVAPLSAVELLKTLVVPGLIRAKLVGKLEQLVDCMNELAGNLWHVSDAVATAR